MDHRRKVDHRRKNTVREEDKDPQKRKVLEEEKSSLKKKKKEKEEQEVKASMTETTNKLRESEKNCWDEEVKKTRGEGRIWDCGRKGKRPLEKIESKRQKILKLKKKNFFATWDVSCSARKDGISHKKPFGWGQNPKGLNSSTPEKALPPSFSLSRFSTCYSLLFYLLPIKRRLN